MADAVSKVLAEVPAQCQCQAETDPDTGELKKCTDEGSCERMLNNVEYVLEVCGTLCRNMPLVQYCNIN